MLAHLIKKSLQTIGLGCTGNEYLNSARLGSTCGFAQDIAVNGYFTNVGKYKSHLGRLLTDNVQILVTKGLVLGQEYESCSVTKALRHRDTLQENKLVRYLECDSGSVARLVVGSLSTTVLHVLKQCKSAVNKLVCLSPLKVDHHTYTAGIMLILRVV